MLHNNNQDLIDIVTEVYGNRSTLFGIDGVYYYVLSFPLLVAHCIPLYVLLHLYFHLSCYPFHSYFLTLSRYNLVILFPFLTSSSAYTVSFPSFFGYRYVSSKDSSLLEEALLYKPWKVRRCSVDTESKRRV